MPAHGGVQVWIEDSQHQKLTHQVELIDLVDDRTVSVKTELLTDEPYTVHCLSSTSVFCDVFIVNPSHERQRVARFHLNKTLAMSQLASVSGSSVNHTEGIFRESGLRTPKESSFLGILGTVEVEIRRTDSDETPPAVNRGEVDVTEFFMVDDFGQPPWLLFRFDINAKGSPIPSDSATERTRRHVSHRMLKKKSGNHCKSSNTQGSYQNETSPKNTHRYLRNSEPHDGYVGSASIGENLVQDRLEKEYKKELAEEKRLFRKLQEQLRTKKARNEGLRRLLGETP